MRIKILTYLLLTLSCFATACTAAFAQLKPLPEKVYVFTDRSLYVAGERIQFEAIISQAAPSDAEAISQVLYCELVTPEGYRITGAKFLIQHQIAEGCIYIPKEVISGCYYLKAYTKQMRNQSPTDFSYTFLKIVNPVISDVLAGTASDSLWASGICQTDKPDKPWFTLASTVVKPNSGNQIRMNTALIAETGLTGYSLSVAPVQTDLLVFTPEKKQHMPSGELFYPESRGLSLTGKLIDKTTNQPKQGYLVNLSLIGELSDVMACKTDSSGRFFFALPTAEGFHDIFISAEKEAGSNTSMLIDNDFSTAIATLPDPVFKLSDSEQQVAIAMAANQQVSHYFDEGSTIASDTIRVAQRAFYGYPSEVLVLDKYIQLPTLEEYFNELPSAVKIRKRQGEKYFKILENNSNLSIYKPLVMIDMVIIDDIDKILAISPQEVARIEVVTDPYVKGGFTYGGIINIISKKSDFAGIDLPSTGMFLSYRFLESTSDCAVPQAQTGNPDARNTLIWKTSLTNEERRTGIVDFATSGLRCRYKVVFRAIDARGNLYSQCSEFEVK